MKRHRITSVMVWPNGMVMVFDERGEQMPAFQGRWVEKKAQILAAFDGEIEFMPEWRPLSRGKEGRHAD